MEHTSLLDWNNIKSHVKDQKFWG